MAYSDKVVFLWINGWVGKFPLFDAAMEWVVSDYMVPALLALTLLGLWFAGDGPAQRLQYQVGVFVALGAMALSNWAVFVINQLYFRPRPFVDLDVSPLFYQPTDSSFPANIAAAAFAIAVAVLVVNRRLGALLVGLAALYGFARVYAGVHYPLDILAGAMIAIAGVFVALKIRDWLEPLPTMAVKAARILCLA